jgi:hypothetical protein
MGNPWTPGPWSLDESNRIVGADGETLVAEARRFTLEEAARVSADRRLQAAAPEMAEVLIGLCKIADEYSAEHGDATIPQEVTQARALLARIRGDAP